MWSVKNEVNIFKVIHFNDLAAPEMLDVAMEVLILKIKVIDYTATLWYCGGHTVKGSRPRDLELYKRKYTHCDTLYHSALCGRYL